MHMHLRTRPRTHAIEKEWPMTETRQLHIALGIARGMAFLHETPLPSDEGACPLIHRDLKPENVLLGPDGEVSSSGGSRSSHRRRSISSSGAEECADRPGWRGDSVPM